MEPLTDPAPTDGAGGEQSSPGPENLAAQVARVAAPVREQVLDLLRREIVELRLRPGHRLIERELVERIGVSRTTIREVLRQLAAEGLVTTIPQRGAIVAIPSSKEAAQLYEVRALLEGAIAKEFTENATDAQLEQLRTAFGAIERSRDAPNGTRAMLEAKSGLYRALFAGADNATIESILGSLQARIAVLRATTLAEPGRPAESVEEIRAIIEAIERRDPDAAAAAAAYHVRQAAETLFARLGHPGEEADRSG